MTAGVYFIIRWHGVLDSDSMYVLIVMSMITVIYAGVVIMGESDLKKVVALSTLIHLGIIIFVISVGM